GLELAFEPRSIGSEGVRRWGHHVASSRRFGLGGSASGGVKRVPVQRRGAAPVGPRRCLATTSVRAVDAGAGGGGRAAPRRARGGSSGASGSGGSGHGSAGGAARLTVRGA